MTFKYGLGDEFIDVLKTLHKLGLDGTEPVEVRGVRGRRRATWWRRCLPDPAFLGDGMTGKTCAGTWVTGIGTRRRPREVYIYHVVDTEETWATRRRAGGHLADRDQSGHRAGARSRAARGRARACSVRRPSTPVPFLDLLNDYGSPWGIDGDARRSPRGYPSLGRGSPSGDGCLQATTAH